jgi:hypothetical protein
VCTSGKFPDHRFAAGSRFSTALKQLEYLRMIAEEHIIYPNPSRTQPGRGNLIGVICADQ